MECVIVDFKITKSGVDINKSTICCGDKEFKIEHPTESGYVSNKPIFANFEYKIDNEEGQPVMIINEEIAEWLMKQFPKRKYKVWQDPNKPILREHVLINYMNDPYDRG